MTEIEAIKPAALVQAARDAADEADAVLNRGREQERITQIMRIGAYLAERNITPVGDPFTNHADGRVCVPIVAGGWNEETETYVHAVAVEWDTLDNGALGLPLMADAEPDEDWAPKRLFPAGYLSDGLADLGRAIVNGGRPYVAPPTAADRVRRALLSVSADYAGPSGEAILAAADAVCEALLDIADAIRTTGAGA